MEYINHELTDLEFIKLRQLILKNLEKLRLPTAVDAVRLTIKTYFKNLKKNDRSNL